MKIVHYNTCPCSLECRDLIRQMLNPDEKTRVTCEQILENDWCKQDIEKVLNEMRRPSLSPDVPPPIVSSRRRSTRTPNAPALPEIPSVGERISLNCPVLSSPMISYVWYSLKCCRKIFLKTKNTEHSVLSPGRGKSVLVKSPRGEQNRTCISLNPVKLSVGKASSGLFSMRHNCYYM